MTITQNYSNIPTQDLSWAWDYDWSWTAQVWTDATPSNIIWVWAERWYTAEVWSFNGGSSEMNYWDVHDLWVWTVKTYSCWVNLDNFTNQNTLFNKNQSAVYTWYWFTFFSATSLSFQKFHSTNQTQTLALTAKTFSTGTWYHIVAVINWSSSKIYVDWVEETLSISDNMGTWDSSNSLVLTTWEHPNHTSKHLDWLFWLARIYDRALSQSEITNLYYEWIRRFGNRASYPQLLQDTVAYYDFKWDAIDIIGWNNGTVSGATLTTDHLWKSNHAYSFRWVPYNDNINITGRS